MHVDYDRVRKYPSTHYHPLTPGRDPNDKVLDTTAHFVGRRVIITEKMDGENASLYRDWYHARSLDSRHHPSRDWIKAFWATIREDIPDGWRICGENLYAKHSIAYDSLKSYFYGFSVWDGQNVALSWDETLIWFDLLGITPVPVLYDGIYEGDQLVQSIWETIDTNKQEGIVIRLADEIPYDLFSVSLCKLVRRDHVTTDEHWMDKEVVPNKLNDKS